ncbi:MAG TPA: glycosyltransferase family 25 protein [Tepidisphaeraceae bacterium]|nr:glycosyltransferase family 25 protein [Tepidisphaeraceae bacterium]
MASPFADTFDRVVVINLARRPDRLARFHRNLTDWPFKPPQRFAAIDGATVSVPPVWQSGAGAWGCMLSHRAVLHSAIADGVSSLLVLEDDALPVPGFAGVAGDFIKRVPADWDCLMLGAEHLQPPAAVSAAIVRCTISIRCHAYALRRRMMPTLLQFWNNTTNDHCDLVLASLMGHFKCYSPDPLLFGQDAGYSDIAGRTERVRFVTPTHLNSLVTRAA